MSLFLIAEIGINHNGDIDIAKKLIDESKSAGFDAVKFQKRDINKVYSKKLLDSPRESPWGKTQRDQKEGLEFGKKDYDEIDSIVKKYSLVCIIEDTNSQTFLSKYDLKFNKIASPMLGNFPLIKQVADEKRKLLFLLACQRSKKLMKWLKYLEKEL